MPTPAGSLDVIAGCMSSGKSEELIRRLRRATIARLPVVVFNSMIDTRTPPMKVQSKDGREIDAITVKDSGEILQHVQETHRVVGIEEAQFFDPAIVDVVQALVHGGKQVIVAGLDTDFRGEPFPVMAQLLAVADHVSKLSAVCVKCGAAATRTQRLIRMQPAPYDAPIILVGGDEFYEARCRGCHDVPRY